MQPLFLNNSLRVIIISKNVTDKIVTPYVKRTVKLS